MGGKANKYEKVCANAIIAIWNKSKNSTAFKTILKNRKLQIEKISFYNMCWKEQKFIFIYRKFD